MDASITTKEVTICIWHYGSEGRNALKNGGQKHIVEYFAIRSEGNCESVVSVCGNSRYRVRRRLRDSYKLLTAPTPGVDLPCGECAEL